MRFRVVAALLLALTAPALAVDQEPGTDSPAESALQSTEPPKFTAGLGVLVVDALGGVASSETGSTSATGPAFFQLTGTGRFPIEGSPWIFQPALHLTVPGRSDEDQSVSRIWLITSFAFAREYSKFSLRGGPALAFHHIRGRGGTVELDNGNSTSTFYKPGRTSTTRMIGLELGSGVWIHRFQSGAIRGDLSAWVVDLLSSRRSVLVSLGVSYGFL